MASIRRKLVVVGDYGGKVCPDKSRMGMTQITLIVSRRRRWSLCSRKGPSQRYVDINWLDVTTNTREQISIITIFETYVADIEVDGKHVELSLWDTGGDEGFDRIRPLAYPNSHVILICFDISYPDSLDNVQEKVRSKLLNTSVLIFIFRLSQWISEVNHFCQGIPIILVGLKKDLRRDPKTIGELWRTGQHPVTYEEVG